MLALRSDGGTGQWLYPSCRVLQVEFGERLAVRSRPQLKDGLAAARDDVLVEFLVESESEIVKDRDRRPVHRTDYGADQSRARERREQLVQEMTSGLGRQLCRFERLGVAATGDHGLPGHPEVTEPADLVRRRLEKAPPAKIQEGRRERPRNATPSAPNGHQDVGARGQAAGEEPAHHWVQETDQPGRASERNRERGDYELTESLPDRHSLIAEEESRWIACHTYGAASLDQVARVSPKIAAVTPPMSRVLRQPDVPPLKGPRFDRVEGRPGTGGA